MAWGKLEDTFWRDRRLKALGQAARDLFGYLITGPQRNRLGYYALDTTLAASDLSTADQPWTHHEVEHELRRLEEAGRLGWDPASGVVFLRRWFRHNDLENVNVAKGAAVQVRTLPFSPFLAELVHAVEGRHRVHLSTNPQGRDVERWTPLVTALHLRLAEEQQLGLAIVDNPGERRPTAIPAENDRNGFETVTERLGDGIETVSNTRARVAVAVAVAVAGGSTSKDFGSPGAEILAIRDSAPEQAVTAPDEQPGTLGRIPWSAEDGTATPVARITARLDDLEDVTSMDDSAHVLQVVPADGLVDELQRPEPLGLSAAEQKALDRWEPVELPDDPMARLLALYPAAGNVLAQLEHPGGTASTDATLRARFLYPDRQETLSDGGVRGLDLDARLVVVAGALLEYADQGERVWSRPLFAGYCRRIRDRDARDRATDASRTASGPVRVFDSQGRQIDPRTGQVASDAPEQPQSLQGDPEPTEAERQAGLQVLRAALEASGPMTAPPSLNGRKTEAQLREEQDRQRRLAREALEAETRRG